ncbi:MAG TPA: DinB family protein [Candidatus Acidoferrales bacterium]|nr:DinB family protein [Candidatus Acidoferrales bacterium]
MQKSIPALGALAFAMALAAPAVPALAQTPPATASFKAEAVRNIQEVEKKLVALAEKFPQEKYGWRPGEGVRSTSEVFMHIAAGNYGYATFFGATRPEGTTGAALEKITDKEKVVETLKASFAHIEAAIQNAPDLDKTVKLFNHEATIREVILQAVTHCHEHLGQLIAYARVNAIVPPWSEHPAPPKPAKN